MPMLAALLGVLTVISFVDGRDFLCFKKPSILVQTNKDYIDMFVNYTTLSPLTFYVNFHTCQVGHRPSIKVVIWNESKRGKDIFINHDFGFCDLRKLDMGSLLFQFFLGELVNTVKQFNFCPLQKGTYTIPKLAFPIKDWLPQYSSGYTNTNMTFYVMNGEKKQWVATVTVRTEFKRNIGRIGCQKFLK